MPLHLPTSPDLCHQVSQYADIERNPELPNLRVPKLANQILGQF